jgi:thiol-disulfide isomerase/thioredoxin
MPYLITANVVLGILCSLDLVLTLGVVRRLRDHSERLSQLTVAPPKPAEPTPMMPVGEAVDGFSVVTTDGETVSPDTFTVPTLVGFFSPECEPCQEQAPEFARFAAAIPGGRGATLAVVLDTGEVSREFAATLAAARVVLEPADGSLAKAFKIKGFPAIGIVDEHGVVVDASYRVDHLAALAAN